MSKPQQIGAQGEKLAQQFLRRRGYQILETNWSSVFGELDIVAEKDGQLVFVEVKARRSADTATALAGITAAKQERMIKAVYQYLRDSATDEDIQWRIDVIAVAIDGRDSAKIAHVEDAFDW